MSINEQVSTLRELAELQNIPYHKRIIKRSADTIESLSAKLQAANIGRSAADKKPGTAIRQNNAY